MKKNGFTLAEVLITLAIIGVVATLTLPSLMTNTAEQQAITAYRKALNTLNEAGQMAAAVDGFDYSALSESTTSATTDITDSTTGATKQSLWALLASRTQVDTARSGLNKGIKGECNTYTFQIFFRDGTALCVKTGESTATTASSVIKAIIDTNGVKGPNLLSTCVDNNCLPSGRAIKDQFYVTLHASNALPGHIQYNSNGSAASIDTTSAGYAAAWAMSK